MESMQRIESLKSYGFSGQFRDQKKIGDRMGMINAKKGLVLKHQGPPNPPHSPSSLGRREQAKRKDEPPWMISQFEI